MLTRSRSSRDAAADGDRARHAPRALEISDELPLFRYWRDAPNGQPLAFAKLGRFGTIEAIRQRVLAGAGVGVVPKYLVQRDLAVKQLVEILPKVVPQPSPPS